MLDVPKPPDFTTAVAGFKWAGLQFPLIVIEPDPNWESAPGGAVEYLRGANASAETLLISFVLVQVVLGLLLIVIHKLIQKRVMKLMSKDVRVAKAVEKVATHVAEQVADDDEEEATMVELKEMKIPSELVFPKFEIVQLAAFYESAMMTCFVAVAAGAVWAKIVGIILVIGINVVIVRLFKQVKGAKEMPYTWYKVNELILSSKGGKCRRNVCENVCEPAKLMLCDRLTKPGSATKNDQRGEWAPKTDAEKLLLGGYGELFGSYTPDHVNFWVFTFVMQLIRVITLALLPGLAQGVILISLSLCDFCLVAKKKPYSSRVSNFQNMYGKLNEFLSLLLLGITPYINLAKPG